ncbi:MAG TPA: class I SAM-dependent methyltransferase [Rhizomicrobium sp.]|jgi:SAM-dependent methyltransferase
MPPTPLSGAVPTPDADVIATYAQALAGHDGDVLRIGDTPELTAFGGIATPLTLPLPFEKDCFTAVIGDGVLNRLSYPDEIRTFFAECARVLVSGGVAALRVLTRPEYPEAIGEIHEHVMRRGIATFDTFKWRLATAVVARDGNPNLSAQAIRENVDRLFFDRGALAEATGWPLAAIRSIDTYKDETAVFSFPTLGQLRSALPDALRLVRTLDTGTYELADRCPLLVIERLY